MKRFLLRCHRLLLFAWVWAIPVSTAYHQIVPESYVRGYLVDYRIPIISLAGMLAGLWLVITLQLPFITRLSLRQIIEQSRGVIISALIASLCFQGGLVLYQLMTQHTLFGYLPFGEVSYASPAIAKGTWIQGTIYKLPYGTTLHPNILAGWSVIVFLCLLFLIRTQRTTLLFCGMVVLFIILTTQSVSALIALLFALLLRFIPKKMQRVGILIIPVIALFFLSTSYVRSSEHASFSRRAQLQQIAVDMIKAHPLSGVGWNNFTRDMDSYGYLSGQVRFLQPVHHVPLLLIAELGILGWIFLILSALVVWKIDHAFLPIFAALWVLASFDHYLLTLTTGRLLLLLTFLMVKLGGSSLHSSMDRTRDF